MAFDMSGSRLMTCEADKTIKIYKEDEEADESTHPIDMKGWEEHVRALKRY
jgi:pleiotropic regulator 1